MSNHGIHQAKTIRQAKRHPFVVWIAQTLRLICVLLLAITAAGQTITDQVDNGGPVLQLRTVNLIFWLPPGFHYDATNTAAADTTYEALMSRFFTDISGSTYLNILSEYPGICAPPSTPTATPCMGPITVGATMVDTRAYGTGAGTASSPLRDIDIQSEISKFVSSKGLTPDLSTGFFVFLGAGAVECLFVGSCFGGNFPEFCAYHRSFSIGGNPVAYAVMPNVDSGGQGCDEGVATAPNQMAADRETVALSHEFSEMITDPLTDNNAWVAVDGSEVADLCTYPYFNDAQLGNVAANGSNVTRNGHFLVLQEDWSNDAESCLVSFVNNLSGPSVETTFTTGNDDLRDNSEVSGRLTAQDGSFFGAQVKVQNQPTWESGSIHVRVSTNPLTSPLKEDLLTLTSHSGFAQGNDHWDIQIMDLKLRNPNGSILCEELQSSNPLASITDGAPVTFPTPNCLPPPPQQEAIVCSVFDDGDTNEQGPTGAIFISGRTTNTLDERGKACMPGGQFGICHKWFGKCHTVTTNVPVKFSVFNDGYADMTATSGAIYIPKDGNQACIPDGTPTGTCRRWFGRGVADDGRQVFCNVFDDGDSNPSTVSDAIYIPHPIPSGGQACIPTSSGPTGLCRRWFGTCVAQ